MILLGHQMTIILFPYELKHFELQNQHSLKQSKIIPQLAFITLHHLQVISKHFIIF